MEQSKIIDTLETYHNPRKKRKKKTKTVKARGPAFSRFEDILLVKAWLSTTMDPTCSTELKGNKYWENLEEVS